MKHLSLVAYFPFSTEEIVFCYFFVFLGNQANPRLENAINSIHGSTNRLRSLLPLLPFNAPPKREMPTFAGTIFKPLSNKAGSETKRKHYRKSNLPWQYIKNKSITRSSRSRADGNTKAIISSIKT